MRIIASLPFIFFVNCSYASSIAGSCRTACHAASTSLKEELQRRRITLPLANTYLQQGYILDANNNKTYNGFLFKNDKGGYEISIPNPAKEECIKRSTKPKSLTLIEGSKSEKSVDIFEGFWDFLTWLEINKLKRTHHDAFVLNSLSFCNEATEMLIKHQQKLTNVFLFLDNDVSGLKAVHSITETLEPYNFMIGTREQLYRNYKDLNECWVHNRSFACNFP